MVLSIDGQSSNSVTLPLFGISAVVNAASFLNTDTAAPEEMISIFANGLGTTNQLYGFPATTVEGVSVTINGVAAPITALAAIGQPDQRGCALEDANHGNGAGSAYYAYGNEYRFSADHESSRAGYFSGD